MRTLLIAKKDSEPTANDYDLAFFFSNIPEAKEKCSKLSSPYKGDTMNVRVNNPYIHEND